MFINKLKEINENMPAIDNNAVINEILGLWQAAIGNYVDQAYKKIQKELIEALKYNRVQTIGKFSKKKVLKAHYWWGGEHFTSCSYYLLNKIIETNKIYQHTPKPKNFGKQFSDDDIGRKLVKLCEKDGLKASYTSEEDSEFAYRKYVIEVIAEI